MIYGADGALLMELAARRAIEPVQLQLNYRSGAGIVTGVGRWRFEKPEAIKRAILRDKRPSNLSCAWRYEWTLRTPSRRSFRRP